jgi:hypothetical protein
VRSQDQRIHWGHEDGPTIAPCSDRISAYATRQKYKSVVEVRDNYLLVNVIRHSNRFFTVAIQKPIDG